ncbi:MAG: T9SS type A sorting domain-containing protein [Bacteroidia bacterium]|nr:T9SS type A sorting domain-containing protein [Bacteroidia bacterium]
MKNTLHTITVLIFILTTQVIFALDGTGTLVSGSITRSFAFHCPGTSVAPNLPVMLVLHGDGGTGAGIKGYSGFDAVSNTQNFLAVYPDAKNSSWNRYADNVPGDAGLNNPSAPDDVLFISDLIAYLCANYQINSQKVYVAGHSAGGFMCYNLALQLPNKIAAFCPVAGNLWGDNTFINNAFSNSFVKVPIYHIHGDADGTVGYPDPDFTPVAWAEWPLSGFSYPTCNNSTYTSTLSILTNSVTKLSFCAPTSTVKEVSLVRIHGGGHNWPNVSGFNAALSIWNFCNTYLKTSATSCAITTGEKEISNSSTVFVYPNPSSGFFSLSNEKNISQIKVFDVLGKEVSCIKATENNYSINNNAKGIYSLQINFANGDKTVKKLIIE